MTDNSKDDALVQALGNAARESAVLEIGLDGTVLAANEAYCAIVGVSAPQLAGHHWSETYKDVSPAALDPVLGRCRAGETVVAQVTRRSRDGRTLLLHCTYVPVRDTSGAVHHVAAAIIDMSADHLAAQGQAELFQALSRSQAVIEFTPAGEIVDANCNFLDCLGYSQLSDIVGRHHRIFVDRAEAASPQYSAFWAALARGENQSAEFRRIRRDGEPVWIVATYSSVTDETGKVLRVVKFASDVTSRKRSVSRLIQGISAMAAGDLSVRLRSPEDPGFAEVFSTFDNAMTGLADVVEDLRARTSTMNDEAGAIATGADELARRGESQAASLEQTAAAVEQISGNISTTSQSAHDADSAARSAEDIVRIGATTVGRAIEAMVRIDEHTRQMGEFTRVIENFAFQTNLLSINAAVEAARAGEVGRGFAVVANEVRNLAQQSAKASQSIAELIGKSEAEVTTGVRLVKDAGGALDQIRAAVEAMAGSVAGIAHATTEQATGVREVSQTLAQLDSVNQSNLSLSDSNAAGAVALSVQVKEMRALLGHFRTQEAADRAAKPQTPKGLRRSA